MITPFVRVLVFFFLIGDVAFRDVSEGEKIFNFSEDMKDVYPGPGKEGRQLILMQEPTPDSTGIQIYYLRQKRNRSPYPYFQMKMFLSLMT